MSCDHWALRPDSSLYHPAPQLQEPQGPQKAIHLLTLSFQALSFNYTAVPFMILESPDGGVIETCGSHPHFSHFLSE